MNDGETRDENGVSIEHDPTMAWEPSDPPEDPEGSASRLEGAFAWALTVSTRGSLSTPTVSLSPILAPRMAHTSTANGTKPGNSPKVTSS
jgi:hypothetical protein